MRVTKINNPFPKGERNRAPITSRDTSRFDHLLDSVVPSALIFSLPISFMDEATIKKAMRLIGARGGFTTAENMTAAQRKARAKKAAAASAKVRSAKVAARGKNGK